MKGGNGRMHYHFDQIRKRRLAEGKEPGLIESGFTLIELLIVIVVLGILAAVVVFALSGVTSSSAQSSCNADAKSVEVAVAAYNTQNGSMPTATTQLVPTYLQSWPNNGTHYVVQLDTTGSGTVFVGPSGSTVNYNAQTASTGCNNPGVK